MSVLRPFEFWIAESNVKKNTRNRDEELSYKHDVVKPPGSKRSFPPRCVPQARPWLGLLGFTLIAGRGTASSRQRLIVVHNSSDDADRFHDYDTCTIQVWYHQYTQSFPSTKCSTPVELLISELETKAAHRFSDLSIVRGCVLVTLHCYIPWQSSSIRRLRFSIGRPSICLMGVVHYILSGTQGE